MKLLSHEEFSRDGGYTIGIGAKSCLYTLRHEFNDTIGVMEGIHKVSRPIRRSHHVRNLGADWAEVATRLPDVLREIGCDEDENVFVPGHCEGKLDPRKAPNPTEIPTELITFGRYEGKTISEIKEKDPDYLFYLSEHYHPSEERERGRWMAFLRDTLSAELAARQKQREAEAEARVVKKAENKVRFAPVAIVLQQNSKQEGDFCSSIARDLESGVAIDELAPRAQHIVADICSRSAGRRNSKAYQEAYDAFLKRYVESEAPPAEITAGAPKAQPEPESPELLP